MFATERTLVCPEPVNQDFCDKLEFVGLGIEAIESHTLEQLEVLLERLNICIERPELFGVLGVQFDAQLGRCISYDGMLLSFTTNFLPILLERKKQIMGQIEALQIEQRMQMLQHSVEQLTDKRSQSQLMTEIDEFREFCQNWREQLNQITHEQERLREQRDLERLALLEKRTRIWLSFLEREPVATVVGALLLMLIALIQVTLLLAQQEPSETLNNSFLLILGYFFGQSVKAGTSAD